MQLRKATLSAPARFRSEVELGRGGMGVVHKAWDARLQRELVLKRVLDPDSEHARQKLANEFRTLKSLRHPLIIEVFEYGVDTRGPFYTMELLDGQDLRALAPLPWRIVCALLRDVASSLALLHARQLLHRDVSPGNIRVTKDQRAKLLDFGALAHFGSPPDVIGTPSCVAPEALRGEPLDQRADVYALGACAYFALTGRHAYEAHSLRALPTAWAAGAPAAPSAHVREVPLALDELVLSLLAPDPVARPSNVAEIIDRLSAIAGLTEAYDVRVIQSYLREPLLVGRGRARARAVERLAELAQRGRGSVLVVEAGAGLGKSAFLADVLCEAWLSGAHAVHLEARSHLGSRALLEALLRQLGGTGPSASLRQSLTPSQRASLISDRAAIDHVCAVVERSAGQRPLVLVVDDADAADPESAAVLGALAKRTAGCRLMLVASCSDAAGSVLLRPLCRHADIMQLAPLDADEVDQLVGSAFGNVPQRKRLSAAIAGSTQGNPLLVMETLRQCVHDGTIRYVDGAWLLPHALPSDSARSLSAALVQQLARVGRDAHELAARLSVEARPVPRAFCVELAARELALPEERARAVLDALVTARILVGDERSLAFSHAELRRTLYAGLTDGERRRLHGQRGAAIRASAVPSDLAAVFAASAHFSQAGDAANAQLMERSTYIVQQPDALVEALPDLLTLYERWQDDPRDRYAILKLTFPLVVAGLYADPALHDRLGADTLTLLERRSGFAWARALQHKLGSLLAVVVGVLMAYVWYLLTPRARRWSEFGYPLGYVGSAVSIATQAALRLDERMHADVLRRLSPLARLPNRLAGRLVYDCIRATEAFSVGRFAEVAQRTAPLLAQAARVLDMDPGSRRQYEHGVHFWLGRNALQARAEGVLEHASLLATSGLRTDWISAQFLCTAYHLVRGEHALAESARERLDELTVRHGQSWSVDVLLALELAPHHLCSDVVGLKRCVQQLEALLPQHPTLSSALAIARALHQGHRGRHAEAVGAYEAMAPVIVPFGHLHWSHARGHWAGCLNALGRHEEALALCDESLAAVGAAALADFSLAYHELARERSLALAGLGRTTEAAGELDALLAQMEGADQPLLLGLLHRDRARVAAAAGDAEAFVLHSTACRVHFVGTHHPALRAQLPRLSKLAERLPPSAVLDSGTATELADGAAIASLRREHDEARRDERALAYLAELAHTHRARLYRVEPAGPRLTAELGGGAWPSDLARELSALAESFGGRGNDTTATEVTSADPDDGYVLCPLVLCGAERRVTAVLVLPQGERGGALPPSRLEQFAALFEGESPSHSTLRTDSVSLTDGSA